MPRRSYEPVIKRLKPDETGRVLDRRRIRRFYLLMTPALLPVLLGGAGGVILGVYDTTEMEIAGGILIGISVLLLIAYCVYESYLVGIYPARCYLRWLRERVDRRRDAIVASDDPNALFVQVIPRENWMVSMGENAGDLGLLRVDSRRGELRYEGDLERWTVPAECIRSYRLKSFTPPNGVPFLNQHWVVVLVVELDRRDTWETPLAAHPLHFEFWTPAKRKRGAELLHDAIAHLVEPDRYPPVDEADLWPLRPPRGR